MSGGGPWERLGIEPTGDARAIRRAYARKLKAIDPDLDRDGFLGLREALERALAAAAASYEPPPAAEDAQGPLPAGEAEAPAPVRIDVAPETDLPAEVGQGGPPPVHVEPARDGGTEPGPGPGHPPDVHVEPSQDGDEIGPEPGAPQDEDEPLILPAAPFQRLEAILFGGEASSYAEVASLAEAILSEPALDRIEVATWVEGWMAETIVRGTPRSDGMIEPAVRYFRWDSGTEDLARPPIVDWILQRREDRLFEEDLAANAPLYDKLLEELRRPPPPPGKLVGVSSWWRAIKMEFLIAYLQSHRQTVLAGLDPTTADMWFNRIVADKAKGGLTGWIRERRRLMIWKRGLFIPRRDVSWLLVLGIILIPYVFVWFLLAPGYSTRARSFGFLWLATAVALSLADPENGPTQPPGTTSAVAPAADQRVAGGGYSAPAADVFALLFNYTGGRVDFVALEGGNPALHKALVDRWTEAAGKNEPRAVFEADVEEILNRGFTSAIRHGSRDALLAYWELYGDIIAERAALRGTSCPRAITPTTFLTGRDKALVQQLAAQLLMPRIAADRVEIPKSIAAGEKSRSFLDELEGAPLDDPALLDAPTGAGITGSACTARARLVALVLRGQEPTREATLRRMAEEL